jgi:FKBP-type peptidyl-prolyl cis-trans isomerase FkpA
MRRHLWTLLTVVTAVAVCSCSNPTTPTTTTAPYSQTDLVVGTGLAATLGTRATVSYTGWLHDSSKPDDKGTQFDSSPSYTFTLGAGQVIKGWDQGVPGMRVEGRRRLVLPPELAYGSVGSGSTIPPNATLVFEIALLAVQ